jgi:hypothetical protein
MIVIHPSVAAAPAKERRKAGDVPLRRKLERQQLLACCQLRCRLPGAEKRLNPPGRPGLLLLQVGLPSSGDSVCVRGAHRITVACQHVSQQTTHVNSLTLSVIGQMDVMRCG